MKTVEELIELEGGDPSETLAGFVSERCDDTSWDRTWSFHAHSYARAFEALWNAEAGRRNDLLRPPLLLLFRHSAELAIKECLQLLHKSAGAPPPPAHHDLLRLWNRLLNEGRKLGYQVDDDMTANCSAILGELQKHDPNGDRFRYPANAKGQLFAASSIDLELLYRAHARIVTICGCWDSELRYGRGYSDHGQLFEEA